jgi:chromosome segregation ATPase
MTNLERLQSRLKRAKQNCRDAEKDYGRLDYEISDLENELDECQRLSSDARCDEYEIIAEQLDNAEEDIFDKLEEKRCQFEDLEASIDNLEDEIAELKEKAKKCKKHVTKVK